MYARTVTFDLNTDMWGEALAFDAYSLTPTTRSPKVMRLSTPGLALPHQIYVALQAQGEGRTGTQALVLAPARLTDLESSRLVSS
jgi:hypothetical protein